MKKIIIQIIIIQIIIISSIIIFANISYATEDSSNSTTVNTGNSSSNITVGEKITLKNNLNLRVTPTLSSNANIVIDKDEEVTVDMKIGKWYKVTGKKVTGWITETKLVAEPQDTATPEPEKEPEPEVPEKVPEEPAEKVPEKTPETIPEENTTSKTGKTGIITVETARVRKAASTSSDVIDTLDEDEIVTILDEENGFYKITTSNISEGYISKTLVKQRDVTSRGSTEERKEAKVTTATNGTSGSEVVEFAKQYLGYPYVLGASSPASGFDCSGFTRYVFANFGYTLGRVAADQTSVGAEVERENLKIGDLLLFYDDGKTKIGHCGIYIGGGDFIHSANPKRGVVIDNLNTNSYYSTRFVTARRIV